MLACFRRCDRTSIGGLTRIALKCLGWIILSGIHLNVLRGAMQCLENVFFSDYWAIDLGTFSRTHPWQVLHRNRVVNGLEFRSRILPCCRLLEQVDVVSKRWVGKIDKNRSLCWLHKHSGAAMFDNLIKFKNSNLTTQSLSFNFNLLSTSSRIDRGTPARTIKVGIDHFAI